MAFLTDHRDIEKMFAHRPNGIQIRINGSDSFCCAAENILKFLFIDDQSKRLGCTEYGRIHFDVNTAMRNNAIISISSGQELVEEIDITCLFNKDLIRILSTSTITDGAIYIEASIPVIHQFTISLTNLIDTAFSAFPYHFYFPTEQFQKKIKEYFEEIKSKLLLCKGHTHPLKDNKNEMFFRSVYDGLCLNDFEKIRISARISNKQGTSVSALIIPLNVTTWEAYTFLFQDKSKQFNRIQYYLHGILIGCLGFNYSQSMKKATCDNGLPTRPGYFAKIGTDVYCIGMRPDRLQMDLCIDENIYRFDTKAERSFFYPSLTFLREEKVILNGSVTSKFLNKYKLKSSEEADEATVRTFLRVQTSGHVIGLGVHFAEVVGALTKELASSQQKDVHILDIFSGSLSQHIPYFHMQKKPQYKVRVRLVDNDKVEFANIDYFRNVFDFEDYTEQYSTINNVIQRFNLYKDINEFGAWQSFGDIFRNDAIDVRTYDMIIANPVHNDAIKFLMANIGYKDSFGKMWPTGEKFIDAIRRHTDIFTMFLMNTEQKDYLNFLLVKLKKVFPCVFTISLFNEIVVVCCKKMKEFIVKRAIDQCVNTYKKHYHIDGSMIRWDKIPVATAKENRMGKIVIFTGPSAAGKDTLIDMILERYQYKNIFHKPTQITSRPPRPGEQYHIPMEFTDTETFNALHEQGEITKAQYNNYLYGTFIYDIKELIDAGINVVLNMNIEGIETILKLTQTGLFSREQVLCVHVTASDNIRAKRLRARSEGTIKKEEFELRMSDNRIYNNLSKKLQLPEASIIEIDNTDPQKGVAINNLERELKKVDVIPRNAQAVSSRLIDSEYECSSSFAFYSDYTNEKAKLANTIKVLLGSKESQHCRHGRYMDIGAGAGQITAEISRFFNNTIAIEPALPMRRFLRDNLRQISYSLPRDSFKYEIYSESWEELLSNRDSLENLGYFDLITMNHVYSFLRSRLKDVYLSIINRLKPCGKLIVTYMGDDCNYENAYEGVKVYFKFLRHWHGLSSYDIIKKIEDRRALESKEKHYPKYREIVEVFQNICSDDSSLLLKRQNVDTTISLEIKPSYSALLKFMFGVYYEELTTKDIHFLGSYLESIGSGVKSHNFFNIVLRNELLMVSKEDTAKC